MEGPDATSELPIAERPGRRVFAALLGGSDRVIWLGVLVYAAFMGAAIVAKAARGDSTFLCTYGRDCSANAWSTKCCRDAEALHMTQVYSCRGRCG